MARDYAKRPKKKASRASSRSQSGKRRSSMPWGWLLTGLMMGLVIGAIAYFKFTVLPPSDAKIAKQAKAQSKSAAPAQKTAAKTHTPPKFDFYTLLPEMEVAVREETPAKPNPPAAVASNNTRDDDIVLPHPLAQAKYRLQLASFKRFNDADTLKAKLAMSGHIVEIHTIKLDNGQVWYRVYTPVLPTREQALSLQKELQNQAISSMLLKAS